MRLSATDEEPTALRVHRHADRRAAGGGRPFVEDLHGLGVDHRDLVPVYQVDENFPLAIGREELGLAAQLDGGVGLAGLGVDVRRDGDHHAGIPAGHQDLAAGRVVDDPVGIVGGLDLAEHLEALQVENDDGAVLAVRDEAAAGAGNEGHAVVALLTGDIGNALARGGVQHHRMGGAR